IRFVHDKLRELSYGEISPERRRSAHRLVAEHLARRAPLDGSLDAALAHHYASAGAHEEAAHHFARAGDRARATYDNAGAATLYRAALAHLGPRDADNARVSIEVHERLGDVLALGGLHAEAREAFANALSDEGLSHARVRRKTAKTWEAQHGYDAALSALSSAEGALAGVPPSPEYWEEWVQVCVDRISVHYWMGQVDRIRHLAGEARPIVERHGTPRQRAHFFQGLIQLGLKRGRYSVSQETAEHARALLEAGEATADATERSTARFGAGMVLLLQDDFAGAEALLNAALSEAERTGDATLRCRCLTYLAVLHRRNGHVDNTFHWAQRAFDTARGTGMLDYEAAASANLGWVVYREGNREEAESRCSAALAQWRALPFVYSFQWLALLPLLAIALDRGDTAAAAEYASAMCDEAQHAASFLAADPVTQVRRARDRGYL
ncbi:serine/threonine-protein kinase PknK, partial [Myxococcota bacterium]|nr:serine/threonine-protein kinase PknK [Myxococcota bacterium]